MVDSGNHSRERQGATFAVLAVSVATFALLQSLIVPVLTTIEAELDTDQATVTRGTLVIWRHWRQNGAMPSVQIKDVPDEVHAVLRRRAAAAHQSLQEYLLSHLIEEARFLTVDEVADSLEGLEGGSFTGQDVVDAIEEGRAGR